MITEKRWKHILGVARKAKEFALKMQPDNEKYAEDMFLLGLLHDLGYEFSETGNDHSSIGGEILKRAGYKYWNEVANHGYSENSLITDELFILNCADMSVSAEGENCTMAERLENICRRYGINSSAYQKACLEIENLQSDSRYSRIK